MIKITKMPTDIRERLFVTDKKGETQLIFYLCENDEIAVTNSEDMFDATNLFFTINKEDWEEIKQFVEDKFNSI